MKTKLHLIISFCAMQFGCSSHIARGFGTHHYLVPSYENLYPGVQLYNFDSAFEYMDLPFSFVWDTILLVLDMINAPFDNYGENSMKLKVNAAQQGDAPGQAKPAR